MNFPQTHEELVADERRRHAESIWKQSPRPGGVAQLVSTTMIWPRDAWGQIVSVKAPSEQLPEGEMVLWGGMRSGGPKTKKRVVSLADVAGVSHVLPHSANQVYSQSGASFIGPGVKRHAGLKQAKAEVEPVRQRTQYSCMAASMSMCLRALGYETDEDQVNRVMGAQPMQGAAWEQALATAQHYGCRATLTMPATVEQLKAWTDAGTPVMIGWNPEGRPWSHASVVFDVDEERNVYVADPNIPNPTKTVRVVPEDDFYHKWYEQFPNYLVRRPACAIQREITPEGRQVMASTKSVGEPVPGTRYTVSDKPGKSPLRGQQTQYLIYNQYGGVVGGNPDREKAIAMAQQMRVASAYMARHAGDLRDRALLDEHEDRWSQVAQGFGDSLVASLHGLKTNKDVNGWGQGSVSLNLGPAFGVRYYSVHWQFGGSTAPNAAMPPGFSCVFFPSIGGRRDWGLLPIKEIERNLTLVTLNVLKKAFPKFGRLAPVKGKYQGIRVEIPEARLEDAWAGLSVVGALLGKAVAQAVEYTASQYTKTRDKTWTDVKQRISDTETTLAALREYLVSAKAEGDDYSVRQYEMQINEKELNLSRLHEQLQGLVNRTAKGKSQEVGQGKRTEKEKNQITVEAPTRRNPYAEAAKGMSGGGSHQNRNKDVAEGRSRKEKHKRPLEAAVDPWWPASGGDWKVRDPEVFGDLVLEESTDYVRDSHVPDSEYFADPELTADGIPELIEQYHSGMEAWRKFDRQGWWPRPVKVQKWHLYITHRPTRKTFDAWFEKNELSKAKIQGALALEVVRGKKYPRWMTPTKYASGKSAVVDTRYKGNPDGEPVKPNVIDHGVSQPLSGGTDVMQQLQNELLKEQGRPQRPDNKKLARCSSNSPSLVEKVAQRYLARTGENR